MYTQEEDSTGGTLITPDGKTFAYAITPDGSSKRAAVKAATEHFAANKPAEYFKADGTRRNSDERYQYRQEAERVEQDIQTRIESSKTKGVENPWTVRRKEAEAEQIGPAIGARAAHDRKVAAYASKEAEWSQEHKQQVAERKAQTDLEASPEYVRLSEQLGATLSISTIDGIEPECASLREAEQWLQAGRIDEAHQIVSSVIGLQLSRSIDQDIRVYEKLWKGHRELVEAMKRRHQIDLNREP